MYVCVFAYVCVCVYVCAVCAFTRDRRSEMAAFRQFGINYTLNALFLLHRFTKPQSFADCVGDELPVGWEESYDQIIGRYYINHFIRTCTHNKENGLTCNVVYYTN